MINSQILNNIKYNINEHPAINGYFKNEMDEKGDVIINIELTLVAYSIDTNTSNILLQYNPIIYISKTEIIICFIFLNKSTLIYPNI